MLFLTWRVQEDGNRAQPSAVFEVTGSPLVRQGPIITFFAEEVFVWLASQTGLGRCFSGESESAGSLVDDAWARAPGVNAWSTRLCISSRCGMRPCIWRS